MHARIGRLNTLRPVIVSPRVQRVPVTSVFQGARLPSRALATPTALPAGDAVEQHQQPGQQRKQPGHEQQQPGHHQKQPQLLLQQGRPQIGPTLRRRSATSLNHHDFSTPLLRSQQLSRHFASSSISGSIPSQSTSKPANTRFDNMAPSQYTTRRVGAANTLEHRVFIEKDGVPVSPFHDIPLYANEQQTILNMVVEVPRWTNAKMEISKEDYLNPIKQDTKKGKLRFVRNCFPHKGYLWNYGAFPQTWEDPNSIHPETKAKGDDDPLDVCEIGELVGYPGQVKQVKVLGTMALIDEEETDWKIMVIDVNDPLASKLNDVEDIERHLPGLLRASNEWFRIYKIPDGKPENQFAFSGECKNRKYATDIVRECAEAWNNLVAGKTAPGGISLANTTVAHSADRVDPAKASASIPRGEDKLPAPIDPSIDKWFFISGASS